MRVVVRVCDNPTTATNESARIVRRAFVQTGRSPGYFDRGFGARFLPGVVPREGVNATVDVRFGGRSLLDESVPLVVTRRRATVTAREPTAAGGLPALPARVNLTTGGFLAVHAGGPDGPIVGHTPFLPPGTHTRNVTVTRGTGIERVIVVAHRDADHDAWFDGPGVDTPFRRSAPTAVVRIDSDGGVYGAATASATPTETPGTAVTDTPTTSLPPTSSTTTASTPTTAATTATTTPTSVADSTTAVSPDGTLPPPVSETAATSPGLGVVIRVIVVGSVVGVVLRRRDDN